MKIKIIFTLAEKGNKVTIGNKGQWRIAAESLESMRITSNNTTTEQPQGIWIDSTQSLGSSHIEDGIL